MIFGKLEDLNGIDLDQLLSDLEKLWHKDSYPKNHLLHEEGSVCNQLFAIEKGLARVFYFKDGKDITAHFAAEKETLTAIDSFMQGKRSRYNIELLEDSTIISISFQDIQHLMEQKPQYEKYLRLFLQQIYVDLAERIESLVFHSAKERYDKLVETNPSLMQRLNLKYVASYIGITQETLSRIRGK